MLNSKQEPPDEHIASRAMDGPTAPPLLNSKQEPPDEHSD
jgi:hypothetical protein